MFHEEHLADEQRARLRVYADLVRRWASRAGLVSERDLPSFERRHITDSLRATPLLRTAPSGAAIDVGSGAGLPGIPLAIADATRFWRLVEPRRKRAAFLEEAIRVLELSSEVVPMTAAQAARVRAYARAHAVAVCRAVAPPRRAFRMLAPFVFVDGLMLVYTGSNADIPPEAEVRAKGLATIRRSTGAPWEADARAPRRC